MPTTPNTYRRTIEHGDGDYWHVAMGPIPGKPVWHQQLTKSSYPFPTAEAAARFAAAHQERDPQRRVEIIHPDGHRTSAA